MTSRVQEFDEELDENFERKGAEGWVTNNRKRGVAAIAASAAETVDNRLGEIEPESK